VTIRSVVLPALLTMAIGAGMPAPPVEIDPTLRDLLADDLKFSRDDLADLAEGRIVTHSLGATTLGEVASVGATWVDASVDTFLTQFRDIVDFKRNENVLQVGRFSNPPVPGDLATLTVEAADLDARDCRVGDCSVRLRAEEILRFRRDIDWSAADAREQSAALFKGMLLDHVRAYWSDGTWRMTEYNDGARPLEPRVEFAAVLKNSPYIGKLVPGLPEHLENFRLVRLAGAEDFLYWSKERFGLSPFTAVTHVTIVPVPPRLVVITSRNVYASRYLNASLGLTIASPTAGGGFILVYVNRSSANALKGFLSSLRRAIVERRTRGSLDQILKGVKTRLEQSRQSPVSP